MQIVGERFSYILDPNNPLKFEYEKEERNENKNDSNDKENAVVNINMNTSDEMQENEISEKPEHKQTKRKSM